MKIIIHNHIQTFALHKKCPYLELFWSAFSHIRTEYREILSPKAEKYGPE